MRNDARKPVPVENPHREPRMIICPACESPNVQSLRVIYEMGTSEINTANSGVVPGFGGNSLTAIGTGMSLGTISGTSKGSQLTEAARQATPPARMNWGRPVFLIMLGLAAFVVYVIFTDTPIAPAALVFAIICVVLGIGGVVFAKKWNAEHWPVLHEQWSKSLKCLKCGQVFVHGEQLKGNLNVDRLPFPARFPNRFASEE
jgi:hypothetical protein